MKPAGVTALMVALWLCAPASAASEPQALALKVELLEQAACLAGPDEYRVGFELRTIYVNTGSAAVAIGLSDERIVGASLSWGADDAVPEAGQVVFAVPRALDETTAAVPTRVAIAEAGWAVTGHATVWLPLSTAAQPPADALTPGSYVARFEVRVPAREIGADDGEAPRHFDHIRVSTPPLSVFVSDPRQVQECGSFTLPLPSVSSE